MKLAALLLLGALAGCAWPSKTHAWCAPQGRINHENQTIYAGIRCAW